MPCGADRAILARVTAGVVAQICVMCYYKILSGNKALSKERKRHGCFEGADGDHRCGDARFSVMDGEQLASDCGQAELGWQAAKLPRVFVRGHPTKQGRLAVILVPGGTELERDRILRQLVG